MLLHPLKGQTPTQCETGPIYDQSLHSKHSKAYIFDQGFQPILELNWITGYKSWLCLQPGYQHINPTGQGLPLAIPKWTRDSTNHGSHKLGHKSEVLEQITGIGVSPRSDLSKCAEARWTK